MSLSLCALLLSHIMSHHRTMYRGLGASLSAMVNELLLDELDHQACHPSSCTVIVSPV